MIIKQQIYPKTVRFSESNKGYIITEKLDGSNLGIGRIGDTLYICQRNNIYTVEEACKEISYHGLKGWLEEHKEDLLKVIYDGSIIFGEWIGMGKISYTNILDKRFYMFGKGRITINTETNEMELTRLSWDRTNLLYAFEGQLIPEYMDLVPLVSMKDSITLTILDELYEDYSNSCNRKVEGFVIYGRESKAISKYVRFKNGKATPHTTKGD